MWSANERLNHWLVSVRLAAGRPRCRETSLSCGKKVHQLSGLAWRWARSDLRPLNSDRPSRPAGAHAATAVCLSEYRNYEMTDSWRYFSLSHRLSSFLWLICVQRAKECDLHLIARAPANTTEALRWIRKTRTHWQLAAVGFKLPQNSANNNKSRDGRWNCNCSKSHTFWRHLQVLHLFSSLLSPVSFYQVQTRRVTDGDSAFFFHRLSANKAATLVSVLIWKNINRPKLDTISDLKFAHNWNCSHFLLNGGSGDISVPYHHCRYKHNVSILLCGVTQASRRCGPPICFETWHYHRVFLAKMSTVASWTAAAVLLTLPMQRRAKTKKQ